MPVLCRGAVHQALRVPSTLASFAALAVTQKPKQHPPVLCRGAVHEALRVPSTLLGTGVKTSFHVDQKQKKTKK